MSGAARLDPAAWSRFTPGQPHPAIELARIALCRVYAGQVAAAGQVVAAFPAGE